LIEIADEFKVTYSSVFGSKRNIYTLVPQQASKQILPPMEFSYFDPKTEEYVTLNSSAISINVEANTAIAAPTTSVNPSSNYALVKAPDAQFKFIKLDTTFQSNEKELFFKSKTFWAFIGFTLAMFPLFLVFSKFNKKDSISERDKNLRKANRLAKKYLSEAKSQLKDSKAFYLALEKALHNYLKAKLRITTSELSKDKIEALLVQKGASSESISNFLNLLKNCEMARYSPQTQTEIDKDFSQAKLTITQLDKNL
jgi:hypothetical protein